MLRYIFAFAIVLLLVPTKSSAQLTDLERSRFSTAASFNFSEPGDVTVIVNVWGTVRYPGLYEVTQGTTVSKLFSLAGGPQANVRSKRTQRTIRARLLRGLGQETVVDAVMLNEILALEDDPVLVEGDVLTVETVERVSFSWRDAFPIIAAVASVAIAVERLSN